MRLSRLFTQTLREAPADVEQPGLALLIRAGYLQPLGSGVFAALPLAEGSLSSLEKLARRCFALEPGQKLALPLTGEKSVEFERLAALASSQLHSYRQLPASLYAVHTLWQPEARPRGGWLNSRWDRILSIYHLSPAEEQQQAVEMLSAGLDSFFTHCQLAVTAAEADPGPGADSAKEWHLPLPGGSGTLFFCPACGYTAEQSAARFTRPATIENQGAAGSVSAQELPLPLEKVPTPHCPTIESLAEFLNIPTARTAKAVFLTASLPPGSNSEPREQLLFAVVRGDREVSEAALMQLSGARSLRPAAAEEIRSVGAVPGYASPIGVRDARVIVDTEVAASPNLVSGANEEGYHLLNVNYGRDYTGDVAEIAAARAGDACPCCGQPLQTVESTPLARLTCMPALAGCSYRDEAGQSRPAGLLSLKINLHRVLAAAAELHHDERGLRLPAAAAPFAVHMILMPGKSGLQPEEMAAALYDQFITAGLEPLLDDRNESAGVRFNDADLIGLPLRITISERALKQGGVEFKLRRGGEPFIVPVADALERARELLE